MFDTLQEKLEGTFRGLRSKGHAHRGRHRRRDARDPARAARGGRQLQGGAHVRRHREGAARRRRRCTRRSIPPQQIVKVVNEELVRLMGTGSSRLTFSQRGPTIVLMAGLQGSGKTTTTAKLAKLLKEQDGKTPALVACDVYRPAAIDQLKTVGAQVGVPVYEQGTDADPVEIAAVGRRSEATAAGADVIIVDTAGRLDIDEQLMDELVRIKQAIKPHNVLLVLDAMTGQEAVSVAERFDEAVAFDGVDPHQARRRRARRRGALGEERHRQADQVRRARRAARRARVLPPGPHGEPHPRHGRRADPHREGRVARSRRTRPLRWRRACARGSSPSTTSSSR